MSDLPRNDDDQHEPATPDLSPKEADRVGREVAPGDALEQAQDVTPAPPAAVPHLGAEVPEADALEQAQEVVDPEEDYEG